MSSTLLQPSLADPAGCAAAAPANRPSPLARWHLLSLDAPTIAALWTWFIAASCGVTLRLTSVAAMFLAVWALYIADRLLDARTLRDGSLIAGTDLHAGNADAFEERHRFHARHRTAFLFAAVTAVLGVACTVALIPAAALRLYAVLGSLLALYFLYIHALNGGRRLPKELAVGGFFSAAVFIPTVARQPGLRMHLLPLALLFGALCSLNCLRIYAWEHPAFRNENCRQRFGTEAVASPSERVLDLHRLTRTALCHLGVIHSALIVVASALACSTRSPIAVAIALSGAALLALHGLRHRLSRVDLRAAADLALAAPLPIALFLRLVH